MKKENVIKIGKNLQQIRRSNGYTQEKLAEKLECSPRYIGDIEQNRAKPSYEALVKICNIFNIGLDQIFGEYLEVTNHKAPEYVMSGFEKLDLENKKTIEYLISFFNKTK